jgi:hypothetical protein
MTQGLKHVVIVLFIFFLVNTASASKFLIAEVMVDTLNIRDSPSNNGKIIGSFKKNERFLHCYQVKTGQ